MTSGSQSNPAVTPLANGGWVVTWNSNNQDGSGIGVYQQYYKADGSRFGYETQINVATGGNQYSSSIGATSDGWVVTYTSNPGTNADIFQRKFTTTNDQLLTAAIETAIGTEGDETLLVAAGGINAGDVLQGKGGWDTLSMTEAGLLDLGLASELTGFEAITGSNGIDIIDITSNIGYASFRVIDGREGANILRLMDGVNYDFRNTTITNFASIKLMEGGSNNVTFSDRTTALLVDATAGRHDLVTLVGNTFTAEQRAQLFRQGVEELIDESGGYTAPPTDPGDPNNPTNPNAPPTNIRPLSFGIQELASNGTLVGTINATDPEGGQLTYSLVNSADGRFKIQGNQLLVDNGFKLDHEQAMSHTVKVRVTDAGGLSHEENLTITVGNLDPEVTAGSTADDVFKGGALNDRLSGNLGNDRLFGGAGADTLRGEAGNDIVGGGEGRDQLYGSRGAGSRDVFLFDTRLTSKTVANRHKDVINDFGSRYDSIYLDDGAFGNATIARFLRGKGASLDAPVKMKSGFFKVGARAEDRDDYFIFNRSNKKLYWDADGSGRKAMVEIATLKLQSGEGTTLTYHDFYFV
jgi:Ca2+-binding RTX toxin-like protein